MATDFAQVQKVTEICSALLPMVTVASRRVDWEQKEIARTRIKAMRPPLWHPPIELSTAVFL